jgi:hypothetical protein
VKPDGTPCTTKRGEVANSGAPLAAVRRRVVARGRRVRQRLRPKGEECDKLNHRPVAHLEEPLTAGTGFDKNICKDLALFAHALMLKASPDRFNHRSGSACRLRF